MAQSFPGANVVYVDKHHPAAQEDGAIFRPFDTVAEGATAVPSGGITSIVAGPYSDRITINSAVTLVAPVGTVSIANANYPEQITIWQPMTLNATGGSVIIGE